MKKILMSLMVIALAVGVLAGASGAFFTDTEVAGPNTMTASTGPDLQVASPYGGQPYAGFPGTEVYNGQNIPGVELTDMKPGEPPIVWRMHVNNIAEQNGVLYIHFNVTRNDENELWEPEVAMGDTENPNPGVPGDPHNGELGGYLLVDVYYGDEKHWVEWQMGNYANFNHVADTINDMHCQQFELGILNAELDPTTANGKDVIIVFTLPGTAPNDAMSDIVECAITFTLLCAEAVP